METAVGLRPFAPDDLSPLTDLVNVHVASATPGFTVPAAWLAARHGLGVSAAMAAESRETWVAHDDGLLLGAAHLVRHVDSGAAEPDLRGRAELSWLVVRPTAVDAGRALLAHALGLLGDGAAVLAAVNGLAPGARGASDAWPHLRGLLREVGLEPTVRELLYAGPVPGSGAMPVPLPGLDVLRQIADRGVAFHAVLDDEQIATFTVDLPDPGLLPGLGRWARVTGMSVDLAHQRRGIGARLVRYASAWLRLAGRDRIFAVVADDERHLGDFWRTLGLGMMSRIGRAYEPVDPE
jgi:GNAT superfamily N-acetyltransferase